MTVQILLRLNETVAQRLKRQVAPRHRSAFVQKLLEAALPPENDDSDPLYLAALAVEQDEALAADMAAWDVTIADGLDNETWWEDRRL